MCRRGEVRDVTMVPVMCVSGFMIQWKMMPIDDCIADLVRALNAVGHPTTAACCGHGEEPGAIGLQDGRVLVVVQSNGRPIGNIVSELAIPVE